MKTGKTPGETTSEARLLTVREAARLLRLSPHTLQSWMSPSSPNYRPEFSRLALRAGRRTLYRTTDLLTWLEQHQATRSILPGSERSVNWFERFVAARGTLNLPYQSEPTPDPSPDSLFRGGFLALDGAPLFAWLANTSEAPRILRLARRAEGLVLPLPTAGWMLRRLRRFPNALDQIQSLLFRSGIFEAASLNEEAVSRISQLPSAIADVAAMSYGAAIVHGASVFATWNTALLEAPGALVLAP
ncbi:MAG TPA: helix-turn-helix domain-containing protein [Candidatus Ozemobacteraceae bacterium]|nr:helix-turn-helix domain-containing protein [Candidatus Ozemobacteraceae bacterium]